MESRHFDTDELTGDVETFYFDHATDQFHIERTADVEPLVELNKAFVNDTPGNWRGDFHHVASIPLVMLPELEKKGIMTAAGRILDRAKLREWLNDRDNQAFRTRPGKL